MEVVSFVWIEMAFYWQVVVATAICIFATIRFVQQSFQMYAETKQWQLNRYMNLLVREGVAYFFAFVLSYSSPPKLTNQILIELMVCDSFLLRGMINILFATGKIPTQYWQTSLLYIIEYVPMWTLTPRFIMNIRELYAQGEHVNGIDTGFGLVSVSDYVRSRTEIIFAEEETEGLRDVENIPMKVATVQPV